MASKNARTIQMDQMESLKPFTPADSHHTYLG